jgi:tetratricopeptide (TPR) repeat protein
LELFAKLYLRLGRTKEAAAAARKAIICERRNLEAWETLLAADADADFQIRESLLREAAEAFQHYPDLNARFLRALAASLRSRGEATEAEAEDRAIARKNQTGRTDLTVEQAAAAISQVLENTPLSEQLRVYKQTLQRYGKGAGMDFYDRVVRPFVHRLASQGNASEAKSALAQARLVLRPDHDSQLDREMTELAENLK